MMLRYFLFALMLNVSGIAMLGNGAVSAQTAGSDRLICITETAIDQRNVRRTPLARVSKNGSDDIVYTINGNESWRRTGIVVRVGQKVEITASGTVRWAPDGSEKIDVTPDGTRPPYRDGWNYNHFPFPEAGIGSLVMRIGKGVYPVGSSAVIVSEDSGYIEFMVNDDVLHDNTGFFTVKLSVRED